MQGLINEYEAENPGIHIEIMEVAYADYENKLKTLLNAGEAPALMRTTNVSSYLDYLVELDEYMPTDFRSRFFPGSGSPLTGSLLARPLSFSCCWLCLL